MLHRSFLLPLAVSTAALLAACGGGSDDDAGDDPSSAIELETSTTTAAPADDRPAWLVGLTDEDFPIREVAGVEVAVDEDNRTIYAEECDDARRLTKEGAEFGPSPRDPDTLESEPGYAFICPS